MSAGDRFEYLWADGDKVKKPIKCSAPEYMEHLMSWVQEILDDETIFPSRVGKFFFLRSYYSRAGHFALLFIIDPSDSF